MSGPVTPSSDSPQIHDARPSRPFSPSPPRDNMHTASRPASFFLGTAVPASPSVSDSRSFNILGLPPTPQAQKTEFYDGLPRHEMPEDIFGQGGAGPKSRKASRVGQPGEVDRTTVTAELAAGRDSLSLVRSMSSDSISSASSASPPLGSASILATLAAEGEIPSIPSSPRGRLSSRSSGYTTPTAKSPSSLAKSPQSVSTIRTALSNPSSIPSSKSMPRLHQPTVVRSVSGRGVSFLPPPSQAVSSSNTTSSIGRSRIPRSSLSARSSLPAQPKLDSDRTRYHSFHGGDSSRPRPASYISELGPPIRSSIPRPSVKTIFAPVASTSKGDRAAEKMLDRGVIEVQGGKVDDNKKEASKSAEDISKSPIVPYGIDTDTPPGLDRVSGESSVRSGISTRSGERSEPERWPVRDEREDRMKDLIRDRHIDQLFPTKSFETDEEEEKGGMTFEPVRERTESTSSRISGGRSHSRRSSGSLIARLTDYLAGDETSYTGARRSEEDRREEEVQSEVKAEDSEQSDKLQDEESGNRSIEDASEKAAQVPIECSPNHSVNSGTAKNVTIEPEEAIEEVISTPSGAEEGLIVSASSESEETMPEKAGDGEKGSMEVNSLTEAANGVQANVEERPRQPLQESAKEAVEEPEEEPELEEDASLFEPGLVEDQMSVPHVEDSRGHFKTVSEDFSLNEITDDEAEAARLSHPPTSGEQLTRDHAPVDGTIYVPPYVPRKSASDRTYRLTTAPSTPAIEDQRFAITLLAGVSRQSRTDPLSLTIPHVELYLAWNEPRNWLWIPARKYIPAIDLKLVKTGQEVALRPLSDARQRELDDRRGIVGGVVRSILIRLPVLWRFANWT